MLGDDLADAVDDATRVIDADGLVVAPGFVDIHTHYDAQVLWDPLCTPSPLHGVTTVIGGNCGFTIAPLADDDVDYLMRMMATVEGMSLGSLQAGPGVGLALVRRLARPHRRQARRQRRLPRRPLDDAARRDGRRRGRWRRDAASRSRRWSSSPHESMRAGALGVSSSLGEAHTDGDGNPVPSRASSHEEFLALAAAVRDHPGTTLEFIAAMGEIPSERIELMADMSLAADRPLNWNILGSLSPTEVYEQQLTSCDRATEKGARVVALTLPDLMRMRAGKILESMPAWRDVVGLPDDERRRRGRRSRHPPASARRRRRSREPRAGGGDEVRPARDRRRARGQ